MPKLKKYVTSVPLTPEASLYDGIAELYFESIDDVEEVGESDVPVDAIEDSKRFLETVSVDRMLVESVVQMCESE